MAMSETTDRGTATFSRVFEAPRELVFRCLLEPEHLTHFWGPTGTTTPVDRITVDARPGGVFETVMVSDADGSSYTMRAVYDEIAEPERIVWTEIGSGMRTVSTFVDLGDGRTELSIEQTDVPAPFLSPEAQAGFATSLDRFQAYVDEQRSAVGR
jgi:uncharacterized protein YndB with AHSA1/START domain